MTKQGLEPLCGLEVHVPRECMIFARAFAKRKQTEAKTAHSAAHRDKKITSLGALTGKLWPAFCSSTGKA